MRIVVRVDDLGWTADEVPDQYPIKLPDMGLALAQRFHAAMQGVPYLGALIPATIADDPQAQAWLAAKPVGLTVAMHGWDHTPRNGENSEFMGLTLDECRERLERGQHLVESLTGAYAEHFVAPFNHFGGPLLDALALEGVRYAWGGGTMRSEQPSDWPTQPPIDRSLGVVHFVPSWARLYGSTRWPFGSAPVLLEELPRVLDYPGTAVLVMHLPWELTRGGPDFEGVAQFAARFGEHIISPAEFVA